MIQTIIVHKKKEVEGVGTFAVIEVGDESSSAYNAAFCDGANFRPFGMPSSAVSIAEKTLDEIVSMEIARRADRKAVARAFNKKEAFATDGSIHIRDLTIEDVDIDESEGDDG